MKVKPHKRPAKGAVSPWMKLSDAAKLLSVHRDTVLKRAYKGEYRIENIGGVMFVSRRDVERAAKAVA